MADMSRKPRELASGITRGFLLWSVTESPAARQSSTSTPNQLRKGRAAMHTFLNLFQQAITGETTLIHAAIEMTSHLWLTVSK